ncbi:hypothetical protein HK104_001731, partial [Borealophlyctis nickersoniae]
MTVPKFILLFTLLLSPTLAHPFDLFRRQSPTCTGLAQLNNVNPRLNTTLALTVPGDSYVGAIQSEGEDISLCAVSVAVLVSGPGMVGVRFSLYDANVWELEEVQNKNATPIASALSGGIAGTTRLVFTFCNPNNPAPIKSDVPIYLLLSLEGTQDNAVVYLSLASGTEALFYGPSLNGTYGISSGQAAEMNLTTSSGLGGGDACPVVPSSITSMEPIATTTTISMEPIADTTTISMEPIADTTTISMEPIATTTTISKRRCHAKTTTTTIMTYLVPTVVPISSTSTDEETATNEPSVLPTPTTRPFTTPPINI